MKFETICRNKINLSFWNFDVVKFYLQAVFFEIFYVLLLCFAKSVAAPRSVIFILALVSKKNKKQHLLLAFFFKYFWYKSKNIPHVYMHSDILLRMILEFSFFSVVNFSFIFFYFIYIDFYEKSSCEFSSERDYTRFSCNFF